ncbi:MAG: DUF1566 domain-containing protein [Candidatus Polarisedimenticolaceae bacterium]|nr:DUF1566 domain-containing protein [Candidatus Polarisedimenticolaceae bacterium]
MLRYITITMALLLSTSAWAQKCTETTAAGTDKSRFTVGEDGTVLDITTGLMWQRCLAGIEGVNCSSGTASKLTKTNAMLQLRIANEDKLDGYSNWRFPSVEELSSLLKEGCKSPSIDLEIFPNTPNSFVWITSPNKQHKHFSWYVHFNTGKSGHIWGNRTYTLRMVRTAVEQEAEPIPIDKSQPYWWKKLSSSK